MNPVAHGGWDAPRLSVVVPAFEEAVHVRAHLERIAAALDRQARTFEIVLVDDGSRDATAAEAAAAAALDPRIRVERHATNLGKGAALETGTRVARGEVLVYLDADLEITPEQLLPLLDRFERLGADVLVGSKYAEGASERRPLHRVLLSRLYWFVTALLFRLPIRDTQTGLKILSRAVAATVIPAVRTRRWAWDIEVLVLAHRAGARIVSGPVTVDFLAGGARIGLRGVVASALDTLIVFLRAKALGAYARVPSRGRRSGPSTGIGSHRRRSFATEVSVSADDLGLCASVDRGILEAARAGRLCSVSLLAEGATAPSAVLALASTGVVEGVHLRFGGAHLASFLASALVGFVSPEEIRAEVRRQVGVARQRGLSPVRLDSHRHAAFPPRVFRAVCAEARALGIGEVRRSVPLGALGVGKGLVGLGKGVLLFLAGIATRGIPHAFALSAPDGISDLEQVDRWVRRGRLPSGLRGARIELVAHPARGEDDVPRAERGPDRGGDATRLEGLGTRLIALGCVVRDGRARDPVAAVRSSSDRRS